jgi:hypothetical protein
MECIHIFRGLPAGLWHSCCLCGVHAPAPSHLTSARPYMILKRMLVGLVLKADPAKHPDLHPLRVLERPRVLFSERLGKFIMWMHIDE